MSKRLQLAASKTGVEGSCPDWPIGNWKRIEQPLGFDRRRNPIATAASNRQLQLTSRIDGNQFTTGGVAVDRLERIDGVANRARCYGMTP